MMQRYQLNVFTNFLIFFFYLLSVDSAEKTFNIRSIFLAEKSRVTQCKYFNNKCFYTYFSQQFWIDLWLPYSASNFYILLHLLRSEEVCCYWRPEWSRDDLSNLADPDLIDVIAEITNWEIFVTWFIPGKTLPSRIWIDMLRNYGQNIIFNRNRLRD